MVRFTATVMVIVLHVGDTLMELVITVVLEDYVY